MSAFAIYGTPSSKGEAYPAMLAISIDEEQSPTVPLDMSRTYPDGWDAKNTTCHFQPLQKVGNPEYSFLSHVVLVEGPAKEGEFNDVYYGDRKMAGGFFIVWYSEERKAFFGLHCATCAANTVRWFAGMQETWKQEHANSQTKSEGPITHQ